MIPLLIHQLFTYGIFALSLLTNGTFIIISTTTQFDHIGRYRYLMILFAVTDMLVSFTHLILMPEVQIALDGHILFGLHLINKPAYMGVWAGILFVLLFSQTFTVLAFHYVYRYAVVCDPKWRRIFKNNATFRWSFLALLAQVLYTLGYYEVIQAGFMPSDYKTSYYRPILLKYGIDVSNVEFGYLAMILRKPSVDPSQPDIWQNDAVVSVIGAALFAFTAVIIFICCFLILHQLRIAKSLSAQMRATQHQLLKALIVQTIIPSIFSYIPIATIFLVPCMGLDLRGIYGDVLIILSALFPALDPVIMLYFVGSYRTRIGIIWKELAHRWTMTVQVVSQASYFTSGPQHSVP